MHLFYYENLYELLIKIDSHPKNALRSKCQQPILQLWKHTLKTRLFVFCLCCFWFLCFFLCFLFPCSHSHTRKLLKPSACPRVCGGVAFAFIAHFLCLTLMPCPKYANKLALRSVEFGFGVFFWLVSCSSRSFRGLQKGRRGKRLAWAMYPICGNLNKPKLKLPDNT